MAEQEKLAKVIEALEWLRENMVDPFNDFMLFGYDGPIVLANKPIIEDALALLKAQEPVPPAQDGCGALICGNQTLGCGVVGMYDVETGRVTEKISNYCAFCGRKVKWDGVD